MSVPAFPARHGLLPCLCLLSLLLHVLAIAWIDLRFDWSSRQAGAAPLVVRLAAPGPAATPSAPPAPAPVEPAPTRPAPAAPAPLPAAIDEPPAPPLIGAAVVAPDPVDAPAREAPPAALQLPTAYRSTPAGTVRIDYRVTRAQADAGGTVRDDGRARLDWETDGVGYRLALDGVLGDLYSEGGLDEGGIAPRRALAPFGAGQATTLFDRRQGAIVSGIGAWRAPLAAGSQDSASVLLQLAAIGAFDPNQLDAEVTIWVGGAAGAHAERYEVTARETIDTGIGMLETVRLARHGAAGAPLLEIWLAPGQAWLPVQLRLTGGDGEVRTQTVAAIAHAAPEGGDGDD